MRGSALWRIVVITTVTAALTTPPAAGQALPSSLKRDTPDAYPPALPARRGPSPPPLAFATLSEIPLPGPLPGEPLRMEDGRVRLPVADGSAIVTLGPELSVDLVPLPTPSTETGGSACGGDWVVSPDGRRRFRSLPEGILLAQRHGRRGWRRLWKLRAAGAMLAPPVLAGRRLFFGSMDNQVYAVRSDNGHRLWAVDVGDRVSRPMTLWRGELPAPKSPTGSVSFELLLLVPDGGRSLIALDPHDGSRVATLELPSEEDRLIPPALATDDGRILVATQKYAPADASLMVVRLGPPPVDPATEGEVAYNASDPPRGGASE